MDTTITHSSDLPSRPLPIVQSYSRGAQFTTVNVGRSAATDGKGEELHSCTTLAVKSASPVTAADVFGLLWAKGL